MTNIRFLKFYSQKWSDKCHIYLPNGLKSLSNKLRYLQWNGYYLESLPSTFCPKLLVKLSMPHSNLGKLWDGVQDLVNLKEINLDFSKHLVELPDLSMATNLDALSLRRCESLRQVHPSILSLHKLQFLDLEGCTEIESLQTDVHLESLRYLSLKKCSSIKEFSVSSKELFALWLEGTAIKKLPSSIWQSENLNQIHLRGCDNLDNLGNKLTHDPGVGSLSCLILSECKQLNASNLCFILDGLQSLTKLYLDHCYNLRSLPDSIGLLSSLEYLNLSGSNVEILSPNIKNLLMLKELRLDNCNKLMSLPKLPPSLKMLAAYKCTQLINASNICLDGLWSLTWLELENCYNLQELPDNIGLLSSLQILDLRGTKVEILSPNIKNLLMLEMLKLDNCKKLVSLPELPSSLRILRLSNCTQLNASNICFDGLQSLTSLNLNNCCNLGALPDNIGLLSSLEYLNLSGSNVEILPPNIKNLLMLKELCHCQMANINLLNVLSAYIPKALGGEWSRKGMIKGCGVHPVYATEHGCSSKQHDLKLEFKGSSKDFVEIESSSSKDINKLQPRAFGFVIEGSNETKNSQEVTHQIITTGMQNENSLYHNFIASKSSKVQEGGEKEDLESEAEQNKSKKRKLKTLKTNLALPTSSKTLKKRNKKIKTKESQPSHSEENEEAVNTIDQGESTPLIEPPLTNSAYPVPSHDQIKQEKLKEQATSSGSGSSLFHQLNISNKSLPKYSPMDLDECLQTLDENPFAILNMLSGDLSFNSAQSESIILKEQSEEPIQKLLENFRELVFTNPLMELLPKDLKFQEIISAYIKTFGTRHGELSVEQVRGLDHFIQFYNQVIDILKQCQNTDGELTQANLETTDLCDKLKDLKTKVVKFDEMVKSNYQRICEIEKRKKEIEDQIRKLRKEEEDLQVEKSFLESTNLKKEKKKEEMINFAKSISIDAVKATKRIVDLEKAKHHLNDIYANFEKCFDQMRSNPPF
ncbi:Leucine-rich repeat, typical subtype [Sesbania bispinosa]|nr:Leucine-rich repeat, typical subtype [Sesbania bispinosa]